jgi:hypothetical protein
MMEASPTANENTTENAYHGMESAQSQSQSQSQQQQHQQQFSCLYTKHKTQKRKIWQDGRLILKGCLAVLHDANPPAGSGDPALCQCELTRPQINHIRSNLHEGNLETEKFLIDVEGAWTRVSSGANLQPTARPPVGAVSTSMKKVLTKKYRKPGAYVPPHPMQRAQQEQQQHQQSSLLGKRRQPLQPGELQRRHYGNLEPQRGDSYNRPPPVNMNQQQQQQHHTRPPPMNLNQDQHQHQSQPQHQQQQHHHLSAGGAPPSSTNNGEYNAGPPPLQSSSQHVRTTPHQRDGYQQAQLHRQPASSNPLNGEHYHHQHQQQHNPYHPHQVTHQTAQVQPLSSRQQPNNDNVPRTNVTPPNNYNYNSTPPQHAPFTNNPGTPSSLAPQNQLQLGVNGTASAMHPITATNAGRLPVTRQEQSSIFATGNGFDPSSFYGEDDLEEDEDDDEDDDDDDDPVQDDSQFSAQPASMQARARDSGIASDRPTTTTTTARNTSPSRTAPAAFPGPPGGGGDSGGTTLSTNELLSLFGAAPAPVPVQQQKAPPSPPVETSYQVSNEARGAETVKEDRVVEDDHFVLPPPSDSSSDEDE